MFKNNQGYALLILLVTVAIIAIIFVLRWAPQNNSKVERQTPIKRALDLQKENQIRVDQQNKELKSLNF